MLPLAGCKVWTESSLYVDDVLKVMETGEAMVTPMTLTFEVPSESACRENAAKIGETLEEVYGSVDSLGCSRIGMDAVAKFTVQAELVYEAENKTADSEQPLYFGVYPAGDVVEVGYFINSDTWRSLYDDLQDQISPIIKPTLEPRLSAIIHNDSSETVSVKMKGVFVNGAAVVGHSPVEVQLKRREQVTVHMSDVQNTALASGAGWIPFAEITQAPEAEKAQ